MSDETDTQEQEVQVRREITAARIAWREAQRIASLNTYRMDDVLPPLEKLLNAMEEEQCDMGYVPGYDSLISAAREQAEYGCFNMAAKTLQLAYELKVLAA